jgi:hypothetical protein
LRGVRQRVGEPPHPSVDVVDDAAYGLDISAGWLVHPASLRGVRYAARWRLVRPPKARSATLTTGWSWPPDTGLEGEDQRE